jgi:hypothetical protein
MRWFSFLGTAVILTVGSTASADDFGRFQPTRLAREAASNPFAAPTADYYAGSMRSGSFNDFPAYPIGFTSFRGLGFFGTCCEKNPAGTEHVWDGYCAQKGHQDHHKPRQGGLFPFGCGCLLKQGGLLSHFACKPDWCCYPECCSSCCGGVGANWWPVTPKFRARCHEPLCCKLHRLHDRCRAMLGLGCAGDGSSDYEATYAPSPTLAEPHPAEAHGPTPAEPKPQLPAPETSIDFSDELPPLSPQDKSARRMDLRRLPAISVAY